MHLPYRGWTLRSVILTFCVSVGYGRRARVDDDFPRSRDSWRLLSRPGRGLQSDSNPSKTLAALFLASNPSYYHVHPASARTASLRLFREGFRSQPRTSIDARMIIDETSLAAKMFGTVVDGIKGLAAKAGIDMETEEEKAKDKEEIDERLDKMRTYKTKDAVVDIDARAQTGDINFRDFIALSEAYMGMGEKALPGMPKLTNQQKVEAAEDFEKGKAIVEVMLDEELEDPELVINDFRQNANIGPRIKRLSDDSGYPVMEVGLFIAKFEAMRESTQRIAAGEDPDDIDESMKAATGNRKQKRKIKKKKEAAERKKEKDKQ